MAGADYVHDMDEEQRSSDGAYYTLPESAALLARLLNDESSIPWDSAEWLDPAWWPECGGILDPCCGEGQLHCSWLLDVRQRALSAGMPESDVDAFLLDGPRTAIVAFDVNPEALQVAANRLQCDTHCLPLGVIDGKAFLGSLELLPMVRGVERQGMLPGLGMVPEFGWERLEPYIETIRPAAGSMGVFLWNPEGRKRVTAAEQYNAQLLRGGAE